MLDEPSLSYIRIDHQSRLQFGRTEVAIGSPFVVASGGTVHRLDPRRREVLGPLLALFPGALRWLWTSSEGELAAVFQSGAQLTVSPDPVSKAWSVGSVHGVPDGPA